MPPKAQDAKADATNARERQVASAAHARSKKQNGAAQQNGSNLKEVVNVTQDTAPPAATVPSQGPGMSWNTASLELLNTYRVAHNLQTPAAFTTPLRQALLANPGIGRQSPTMARKREKRRISKDQLALAVRKNFNGAAVNEIDVVVEMVYKVRNQKKTFRMRSLPGPAKK